MKNQIIIAAAVVVLLPFAAMAQPQQRPAEPTPDYQFTVVKENPVTSIKNQSNSGTCWCFSALSFLESEAIRLGNIKDKADYPDFSEMFVVSKSYKDRAEKYVRVEGNLGFSAGSEADDVLHVVRDYGLVPQSAMPGLQVLPNHNELDATTKAYVQAVSGSRGNLSTNWKKGFEGILDAYLGVCPESFEYNGKTYTPASYRDEMKINPDDYVTLTSFTHHPFYTKFAIEVADNWRWDEAYNVPIDEFMEALYNAINNGYTAAWGTDVSERGFTRNGIAVLLEDAPRASAGSDQARWVGTDNPNDPAQASALPKEIVPDQAFRQAGFDNRQTTDDHGMHIFGLAKDQNGTNYFMVKNSWGETGKYKGIWYASDSFVRGKSMDILLHKDALPKALAKKLGIK